MAPVVVVEVLLLLLPFLVLLPSAVESQEQLIIISNFSSASSGTFTSTTSSANTTTSGNCYAGGGGYGVAMDWNRADVIGLLYEDIPQTKVTIEFWYKVLDRHQYMQSILSYSVYKYDDPLTVYEQADELNLQFGVESIFFRRGTEELMGMTSIKDPLVGKPYQDLDWHHYAFVWDTRNSSVAFYLDGKQLDYGTTSISYMSGVNSTTTTRNEVAYTNAPFGASWDATPISDAQEPFLGRNTYPMVHIQNPCSSLSEQRSSENSSDKFIALVERSEECSDYEQAQNVNAIDGVWAIIFWSADNASEEEKEEEGHGGPVLVSNGTEEVLSIPVVSVDYETGEQLFLQLSETGGQNGQQHATMEVTFTRLKEAEGGPGGDLSIPVRQGGVMIIGQEADAPWSDFDELQAATGILDEVRIWNTTRSAQEILDNYRIGATNTLLESHEAQEHLNLYWTFDDLGKAPRNGDNNGDDSSQGNNQFGVQVTTEDLSPGGGHTGLVGSLPTVKNEMTYVDGRKPMPPTRPDPLPVTTIPVFGSSSNSAEVVIPVSAGQRIEVELKSFDPDGDDLLTTIISSPTRGQIYSLDVDGEDAMMIEALEVGDIVLDPNRTQNKRVVFVAPQTFEADAVFGYSVSDGGEPVNVTVRMVPHRIFQPISDMVSVKEDGLVYMALARPSQLTQKNMKVVIESLPERGTLYEAQFNAEKRGEYEDIAKELDQFGPMQPINQTGYILSTERGIVMFAPDADDFSGANEAYASFGFRYRDEEANLESKVGFKSIIVEGVNDAPYSISRNISSHHQLKVFIDLKSRDVDANRSKGAFPTRTYSRVTTFPKGGLMYQYGEANEFYIGPPMDSSVTKVPQTSMWASNVVRYSSQYSRCGAECWSWRHPDCPSADLKGGGRSNGTCTQTSWHASNILSAPDYYPKYGDSPLVWSPSHQNGGNEFIELEFPHEVFVNAVEIYETYKPGTVWKISVASEYLDDIERHCAFAGYPGVPELIPECTQVTKWETLWRRPRESLSLSGEQATVFDPPLCPGLVKTKYMRIDLDTSQVKNWNTIDAVGLRGTLQYPPGVVSDEHSRVVYVPGDGIHGVDSFGFATSDCQIEGEESIYNIVIAPPDENQFSSSVLQQFTLYLDAEPNEIINYQLDLSPALRRIRSNHGLEIESGTATIHYSTALGSKAGTTFDLNHSTNRIGNPTINLTLGAENYGTTHSQVEVWIHDEAASPFTFRFHYKLRLHVECVNGQLDASKGKCLCSSAKWSGPSCSIEVEEDRNDVPLVFQGLGYCYFAVLVTMCIGFSVIVHLRQKALIVRISQPFFLQTLLAGSIITSVSIPLRVAVESDALCATTYWVFFVGFSVMFGSLFAKIWRTYQVFASGMKMRRKQVSIKETSAIIAVLFAMNVFLLSLWTGLDPPQWQRTVLLDDGDGYALSTVGECTSTTDSPYIMACFSMNLLALCGACILSVRARKIPDKFSEVYAINFCTYSTLNVSVIGIPILMLVQDNPSATLFVECSIVFLVVFATLICVFGNLVSWLFWSSEGSVKRDIDQAVRDMATLESSKRKSLENEKRESTESNTASKYGLLDGSSHYSSFAPMGQTSYTARCVNAQPPEAAKAAHSRDMIIPSKPDGVQSTKMNENDNLSDKDRFSAALDMLAEIQPLLQQNPELLAGEPDDLGRRPLDVLRERAASLSRIAEQYATATD